jgi:SAM-dependent methyltransferase
VADFRELEAAVPGQFDAVISFDNSIAHMPTETELERALISMTAKVRPGGALLLSLRDYDQLAQEQPRSTPLTVKDGPQGRSIVFQVWDWQADASGYTASLFTLRQRGEAWETLCVTSDLHAWRRAQVETALTKAGLTGITWVLPDTGDYYQPIVIARKPTAHQ